jgi:hypothetical protein
MESPAEPDESSSGQRQTLAEDIEMMEIAEEVVGEDIVTPTGIEVELGGEMIYEELVQDEEEEEEEDPSCVEIPVDESNVGILLVEAENDKENTESEAGEPDFPDEDAEGILEITRRRISQDREGNCYW